MKNARRLNTEFEYKFVYILVLLAVIILITGCGSVGPNYGNTDINKKYYQGYDSLELEFLEDSPPNIFYYDSEDIGNNEIPIIVQVKNTGVSDAWGSLFIHGYDRSMISVAGDGYVSGGYTNGGIGSGNVWLSNGGLSINFGGIYIGLRGTGQTLTQVGFMSPNGISYGASVFTQGNQVRGLSAGITTGRIGSRLAPYAFNMLQTYTGYNAPIVLEGDTQYSPGGGIEIYEFPALIYYLPPSIDQFRQPIMVTACYEYVTHNVAMVCVDPSPHSNSKKACTARTVSMSAGQGSPVAITRVEQQASSSKTVFTIYLHHNKKNSLDDLYDYESLWKCNPESPSVVKPTDKNVVYIGYIALSGRDITLDCAPNRKIRLDSSGNGQIACTAYFPQNSESAYEAPLEIELWYGYSKNIYKEILIKRI